MREFQTRRTVRKILLLPAVLVLCIAVLMISYSLVREYLGLRQAAAAREKVERELAELHKKRDTLQERIAELDSDTGMEKIMKERLNVARPGEELLVIVRNDGSENGDSARGGQGFFSALWATIKNIF